MLLAHGRITRHMTTMQLITTTSELARVCADLKTEQYVTVDTEFMRETTFWPQLCLVQLAGTSHQVLVDPLANGIDLQPLFELMAHPGVVKVFHAARQDIEIFFNLAKIIPGPIFDTQIAAMVCGFGESISYMNLAKTLANANIDKSSQYTDWSNRPLTEKQLTYALADVTHLRIIYEKLVTQLHKNGRERWLDEEMKTLTDVETYQSRPENAWRRMKMRVKSRRSIGIMMELAAWREHRAQRTNTPRQRIMKDDAIFDLANQAPKTKKDLSRLRTISDNFVKSEKADEVLAAIDRGLHREPDTLPSMKRTAAPDADESAVIELLKVYLKAVAARYGVAKKLIATSDDLEALARSDRPDSLAITGWRAELFGNDALKLKRGEVALSLQKGEVRLVPVPILETVAPAAD